MRDDGRVVCECCGLPRRMFVVFVHERGEYQVCATCVGKDLVRRDRPTMKPRGGDKS
jgi:hypothetical protein